MALNTEQHHLTHCENSRELPCSRSSRTLGETTSVISPRVTCSISVYSEPCKVTDRTHLQREHSRKHAARAYHRRTQVCKKWETL